MTPVSDELSMTVLIECRLGFIPEESCGTTSLLLIRFFKCDRFSLTDTLYSEQIT